MLSSGRTFKRVSCALFAPSQGTSHIAPNITCSYYQRKNLQSIPMGDTAADRRAVRAAYTDKTITVYQAYAPSIAEPALRAGKLIAPFKRERMTWIKPSFLWMAYRCGWATKPNQERVLAVEISREGFEWALAHSCLSHHNPQTNQLALKEWEERKRTSPVRIQWDPERGLDLHPLGNGQRSIQIGIGGNAVDKYLDEWIVSITDVTKTMREVSRLVSLNDLEAARRALPAERPYPLPDHVARAVEASSAAQ